MNLAEKKHLPSTIAFLVLLAALVTVFALYFRTIVKWSEYPDFGYSFRSATGLKVIGVVTKHGEQSGLRVGDRILTVNGKDFNTIEELRAVMNTEPAQENSYFLEREGQRFNVIIQNVPSGFMRSFERSGFSFLLGICYALIGTLVFLMKPHRRPSWVFFLFAATFGVFLGFMNPVGKISPPWLEYPILIGYCFTPAVFLHLALTFPQENRVLLRYPYVQFIPYLFSLALFVLISQATRVIAYASKFWSTVAVVYMALGVLFFIGSCLHLRVSAKSPIVRVRARMILVGFAFQLLFAFLYGFPDFCWVLHRQA
ncbi:MAG: hypothetical protein H6Q48_4389 [Deltaproteobacteria bacterium]|nr:hypothetical protein [Deltaproteobacteria bacterium]